MFVQSVIQMLGLQIADALLGALSARPAAALLVTPTVHLFTAGPTPILSSSVSADFTEATYVGYAAQPLTLPLVGPLNLPGNVGVGSFGTANFVAGAVVAPGQTILGYWIDTGAPGQIIYGEAFQSPAPMVHAGDFISLDVVFALLNPMSLR